jgi:hypothetical protein
MMRAGMSPPAAPARPARASDSDPYGYFDGVVDGHATGWCCRPADLSQRLNVEVIVDGKPVGAGVADRRRDAVARAGYGDGRYGFRVALPEGLDDGGRHRIAVRVDGVPLATAPSFIRGRRRPTGDDEADRNGQWANTRFIPQAAPGAAPAPAAKDRKEPKGAPSTPAKDGKEPSGAPSTPAPEPVPAAPKAGGALTGYIDGVIGGDVVGWVVERLRPKKALRIVAMLDGEKFADAVADVSREDIKRQGYGDRHGFRLPLPGRLEPGHHTIVVRAVDGGQRVPLAKSYVVLDGESKPIEGIVLLEAMSGAPPPAPAAGNEALLGLDGWIFEFVVPDFDMLRGAEPVSDDVMARHLVRVRERHQLARLVDAVALEAVIPARMAVYAERLPVGLTIEESARPVDRLLALVREQNDLDVLDLTAPLRQAKQHGGVFARTARGLTWLGAFAAYRAIAKQLAKSVDGIVPVTRGQLGFGELERSADSLAELPRRVWIGTSTVLAGSAAEDEEYEGQPRLEWARLSTEYTVVPPEIADVAGSEVAMLRRREPGGVQGDALVIHDGAAERIAPFLAEHFERTLVVGAGADIDRVTAILKPGVIVEIVAEAALLRA